MNLGCHSARAVIIAPNIIFRIVLGSIRPRQLAVLVIIRVSPGSWGFLSREEYLLRFLSAKPVVIIFVSSTGPGLYLEYFSAAIERNGIRDRWVSRRSIQNSICNKPAPITGPFVSDGI